MKTYSSAEYLFAFDTVSIGYWIIFMDHLIKLNAYLEANLNPQANVSMLRALTFCLMFFTKVMKIKQTTKHVTCDFRFPPLSFVNLCCLLYRHPPKTPLYSRFACFVSTLTLSAKCLQLVVACSNELSSRAIK